MEEWVSEYVTVYEEDFSDLGAGEDVQVVNFLHQADQDEEYVWEEVEYETLVTYYEEEEEGYSWEEVLFEEVVGVDVEEEEQDVEFGEMNSEELQDLLVNLKAEVGEEDDSIIFSEEQEQGRKKVRKVRQVWRKRQITRPFRASDKDAEKKDEKKQKKQKKVRTLKRVRVAK